MGTTPERRTANHAQIAQELAARPYVWGTVATYQAPYVAAETARKIRYAQDTFRVYGPAGSFETRVIPVEDGTLLEARYVRGIARALPGLIQGTPATERAAQFWPDAVSPLSPATPATTPAPNRSVMTERALPHDPYITAVVDALTAAGLTPTDRSFTSDAETLGVYCYLNAVLALDPSRTDDVPDEDIPDDAAWPHGLILVWEWHTGREEGGTERGGFWMFAERKADGSNEYPAWLPVQADAAPEAVVDCVRLVIDRSIKPGAPGGYPSGVFTADERSWERAAELEAAVTAWDVPE